MRFFILDDHEFYCQDIIEYLKEKGQEVFYAKTYKEANELISTLDKIDVSFIDIILNNGKTGLHFLSLWEYKLGNIFILTGCVDANTLDKVKKWKVIQKADNILNIIDEIISQGNQSNS